MNKAKLKYYAPLARRQFIQAVTDRSHYYGLSKNKQEPVKVDGDFAIITGRAFPKAVAEQRTKLEERIAASSFEQVMEEIAYTWFNRFVAIRYMELHGYLSHGYRVLSNPEPNNNNPEILEKAQFVELPGLDKNKVLEFKMAGNKDEELYRLLLIAQCNELHRAMPFLFESIKDCTELLLPDNLLHSDSLIRELVNEIEEKDWQEVEIIGWMYQFYISEKKDQVIGSVVKSENIPAATQLFTPNWIVKYLVQNSLGAQWMRVYPDSALKSKMEYYIESAQQSEEVQKQLKEITPDSLNPEELTLLDPACGSGHILVEAYDLLKEIYLERGYRKRDIPELILKKNLFGLEIDDRAAQLAGFAVMMKARCDERQIFERQIQPNIVSIKETKELDLREIVRTINAPLTEKDVDQSPASLEELQTAIETPLFVPQDRKKEIQLDEQEKLTVDDLKALLGLFEHGKTFGSLIRIPESLAKKLPAIAVRVNTAYTSGNLSAFGASQKVLPFINQALMMAGRYDAVVANPPYMGSKGMNTILKQYAKDEFPDTKSDLFAMFIERLIEYCAPYGSLGLMTPFVWMFLLSYEKLRRKIVNSYNITTLVQPEYHSFFESAYVPICAFVINKAKANLPGVYIRLEDFYGESIQHIKALEAVNDPMCKWRYEVEIDNFKKIPNTLFAYWISDSLRDIFSKFPNIGSRAKKGLSTSDNDSFLRFWQEISCLQATFGGGSKWFPMTKGGDFRKWYGNISILINWENNGSAVKSFAKSVIRNEAYYLQNGITWTYISVANFCARYVPINCICNAAGPMIYGGNIMRQLGAVNSKVIAHIANFLCPTMTFEVGTVSKFPVIEESDSIAEKVTERLVDISKTDWDSFETSWDFERLALLQHKSSLPTSYDTYRQNCREMTSKMEELEEQNNKIFIKAYGLEDELTPEVLDEQITLFANPKYRYGGKLSEEELENRFREDSVKELLSYSVGCMMGRYSLDELGLVYAHSGNEGFDSSKYKTFSADNDGIIPISDFAWFDDDVAERFFKFIESVWDKNTLEENLDFAAEAIGRKSSESSREAIKRFFCNDFFKDHLKRYKKRPIYWLFTSGKEKAFQCLVYLHRYNEGTLSRMRTEYVIPLQGRVNNRISMLQKDVENASSTSAANKLRKEIIQLEKQAEESRKFDEKLRHYADMKIKLDLDDGVKVNYGKFGDLLAEVKSVTGSKEE